MDDYKNKYNNIVSKLLELIEKEKILDKVDEEIENNLQNRELCNKELEHLKDKFYNMKHDVIVTKSNKCLGRALLFSLISGLLFVYVGVKFVPSLWIAIIYIVLNIIAHRNMYIKKVNDKEFMFGELERNSEYICLNEQINSKNRELCNLDASYEKLVNQTEELLLETGYLYTMIYGFVSEEEMQKGIDEALENGAELEIKYAESKGLVKRRVKKKL